MDPTLSPSPDPDECARRTDVLVVGGGPAGLMAAVTAAHQGARVLLCEQLARVGAKLMATGGGRCNLTNTVPTDAFMARFGRQGRFMQPALAAMDAAALRQWFDRLGVPTHSPDGLCVFPVSNSARDVRDALLGELDRLQVVRLENTGVDALLASDGRVVGVETETGRVGARCVVVATGGKGYAPLGGTGAGYTLARQVGHKLVEPLPALAPLVVREPWVGRCTGVSLPRARLWIDLPRQSSAGRTDAVLFTHTGLSGPAALDLSGDVETALERRRAKAGPDDDPAVPLRLNVDLDSTTDDWLARFDRWRARYGRRRIRNLLAEGLPQALARGLCDALGIEQEVRASDLSAVHRRTLAEQLVAWPLTATGTEGFANAMVTRGGVRLREIEPRTLESRLAPGLYFAGEVLDLDGPCGGYNLQWAFSSGHLAGLSAAAASTQSGSTC